MGQYRFQRLAFVFLFVLFSAAASADPLVCCTSQDSNCRQAYHGNRVALVVGVNKYSGSNTAFADRLNDLVNANRDAATVAEILAGQQYAVRCMTDPTADEFAAELQVLKNHLASQPTSGDALTGNSVIVHFSGHGFRAGAADFIFFSGDYTEGDFRNNALRVDELVGAFSSFGHLTIDFVIDACRNPSMTQPRWMTSGFFPATEYGPKKNSSHGLIFSTSESRLALDVSVDIGATDNGAFIYVAKKYLGLPFVDIELVYRLVGDDADMRKVSQVPDIAIAANYFASPMRGPSFDCTYASLAVQRFGACSRAQNIGQPCEMACSTFNHYLKVESSRAFCQRNAIERLFPASRNCQPIDLSATVAVVLGTVPVAMSAASTDIAILRKQAQLASTQLRVGSIRFETVQGRGTPSKGTVKDLVEFTQTLSDGATRPSGRGPSSAQVFDIRTKILKATRDAVGPLTGFSELASTSFKAPDGPIELQLVPGTIGGTTGPIEPTGAPKVDCLTQYCDPNWVMVRVPTASGTIDGWIDAKKVVAAPAADLAQVSFLEDGARVTRESLAGLQRLIDIATRQPKAVLKITSVTKPADADRVRAGQQSAWVQLLFERRGIDPERIASRIVELDDTRDFAPVTVELLN